MKLCIVTPTRARWEWLAQQAEALGPQLEDGDVWVIVVDSDQIPPEFQDTLGAVGGRAIVVELVYPWRYPPMGNVNRARNAGTAMCPAACEGIVELDDHDILEQDALRKIRAALDRGADYVFGDHHTIALEEISPGTRIIETWGDVRHNFTPGAFERGEIDGVGVRAFTTGLWRQLAGWDGRAFPGGDVDFALRAERAGKTIFHLDDILCTVTIDPDSIMTAMRDIAKAKRD